MYGKTETIKIKIPYPEKTAEVRLPTEEEVTQYLDSFARKGRKEDDRKPDLELFKKIRTDQGDDFDEFEAAHVVNNPLNQSIVSCDKAGHEYLVVLKTPFGQTNHVL